MLVEIPADESEQQVRNSFIELSWMARQHVDLCEDESEVTTSRTANNLGVHQIAQADAAGSDRCGNGYIVEHCPQGHLVLAHIEPQGYHQSQGATMASQPLITDKAYARIREADRQEHLDEMGKTGQIIGWFVEQAVTQARTDEDAEEAIKEQRLKLLFLYLLIPVEFLYYEVGSCESYHPKEGVETYRTNAKRGIPGYHVLTR